MATTADDSVTAQDQQQVQTQLEILTTSTQLIHDFMLSPNASIANPEGGVIRTITGINQAIDSALPGYEDVQEAVTAANAAKAGAETAQQAAEDAAASAGAQATSAIYKVKDYASAATVAITPMAATIHRITLTSVSTALTVGATTDADGQARQIRIEIKQGTGSNKIPTWPANVKWAYDRKPVLSYQKDRVDIVDLITEDKGATWRGAFNGGWFNA